jgi:hypothetical protein
MPAPVKTAPADKSHTAADVVRAVHISQAYRSLTGAEPRHAGNARYRVRAVWRDGDGLSVSLDDSRGVWHDFVTGEGGGVLDLVQLIRGGTKHEALRWVADFAGMPLEEKPFSPADRAEWAKKRQDLEQALPDARRWQRAAVNMTEDVLVTLKAALFDPALDQPDTFEIYNAEQLLSRLRRIDGEELVLEYRRWLESCPGMAAAMARAMKERERLEERTLLELLRQSEPGVEAA